MLVRLLCRIRLFRLMLVHGFCQHIFQILNYLFQNHAEFVSAPTLQRFVEKASLAHESICAGHPLRTVFGKNLDLSTTVTDPHSDLVLKLQQVYPPEVTLTLTLFDHSI